MKLQDFVSETLKEIIDGVRVSQDYAQGKGGRVNPSHLTHIGGKPYSELWDHETGTKPQVIEFDVAVTAIEGKETKGSIGVFVGPVGIGTQGKSDSSSSSISRIKFSVPVILPAHDWKGSQKTKS